MQSKYRIFCGLMISIVFVGCASPQQPMTADIVFRNVNVVPMNQNRVLRNKTVAVKDGKIVAIGSQSSTSRIEADQRVDGAGLYLMPGLADMHMHVRMNPQATFNLLLANGVTTATSVALDERWGKIDHLQLRSDVEAGTMVGPRYLVSGPQLNSGNLKTLEDVTKYLNEHVELNYDVIKIHGDLSTEVYDALITGAHERGLRVTGHTQREKPLSHSFVQDSIEHIEEFIYVSPEGFGPAVHEWPAFFDTYYEYVRRLHDPEFRGSIVEDVAASGIYLDPTLIIFRMIHDWRNDETFAAMQDDELNVYLPAWKLNTWLDADKNTYRREMFFSAEHLKSTGDLLSTLMFEFHEAGVPLLLGTDSFGTLVPGFSVHKELALMTNAGMTPYEALKTGTVNVAAYLEESDQAGTVEVGKRANFILVKGNPLRDVANAGKVHGVYTLGNWHSKSDLDAMLEDAKALVANEPLIEATRNEN